MGTWEDYETQRSLDVWAGKLEKTLMETSQAKGTCYTLNHPLWGSVHSYHFEGGPPVTDSLVLELILNLAYWKRCIQAIPHVKGPFI